jgi:hypothetical protein
MVSLDSATELIQLEHFSSGGNDVDYIPTFINTDRRGQSTSLGYWQIGSTEQHGQTYSPVYKMIFADLSNVTATHIKIWGISNIGNEAVIFPVRYFASDPLGNSVLDIYLNKFEFTDAVGNVVAPGGDYSIIGCKKKSMPLTY